MPSFTQSPPLGGADGPLSPDEWRSFLTFAGTQIYKGATAESFLDWVSKSGPFLLTSMVNLLAGKEDASVLMRSMGVELWNQFPIPAHDWVPRPLNRPGRNDACWCHSGRKYKQCCEPLTRFKFPPVNLLRFVLDACPATRLAAIAESRHISLLAVADTANQWTEEGDGKRSVALLEPFFASPKPLTSKLEPLFDELMNALLDEGRGKRREHWIAEVLARGDNILKATALQRRATMFSDRGQYDKAWADFQQAQRFNPNDPALSMLEVSMLMGEGNRVQAAQRAAWWAVHLGKLRDPALAELVGHLHSFSQDPDEAMFDLACDAMPQVDDLAELLETAPTPQKVHTLAIHQDDSDPDRSEPVLMGEVVPGAALRTLEDEWRTVFAQLKPSMIDFAHDSEEVWDNSDGWLDLLEREPVLWNSFEVLDDLVMAVGTLEMSGVDEKLLVPIAERAVDLLRALVQAQPDVRVPWVIWSNRHVLRPIAHLAYICKEDGKWDRFMDLAHWLVFELNPNDNHGLRYDLSHACVLHGSPERALVLRDRFPNDISPTLVFNAALAEFQLGHSEAAEQWLRQAKKRHPKVLTMLLKPNPKPVKPDDWGVKVGGAFEAWLYVEEHQPLWQECGALAWAADVLKKVR